MRAVAGRRYSKLWGVDLHEGTWRMTDSGSGATLDKVRRWVQYTMTKVILIHTGVLMIHIIFNKATLSISVFNQLECHFPQKI